LQWVLEQLSGTGPISSRRMFGAIGLYREEVFFAIISNDVLYFKVGDANRADYETRGAAQFRPFRDKPHLSMSYYEVPADILEDAEECAVWLQRAVNAALAAKASPRRKSVGKRHARVTRP
jgi:DNA transformation protein